MSFCMIAIQSITIWKATPKTLLDLREHRKASKLRKNGLIDTTTWIPSEGIPYYQNKPKKL